jgi:hypothetical protein
MADTQNMRSPSATDKTSRQKDDFETDAERDAWQKGYSAFQPYDGPPTPIQRRHESWGISAVGVNVEALESLYARLPEDLHKAATDGWWSAFLDEMNQRTRN